MDKSNKAVFDRNLPYNNLPELPPRENFLDTEVLLKWGIASRTLAELNRNILRIPNPTMLVNTISLQEAQSSTAIENIFTTEDELYKAVTDNIKEEEADPSTKEVLRYREALWGGYNSLIKQQSIDTETIIRIFQLVKNTTQQIRPPQSQVVIKRGQSKHKSGEVVYTPPRGEGIVEEKLDNLLHFMNLDNGIDPLLKMVIAHYQFEAIHPFTDGNGRTGRIINLLYLIDQQLLSHPVLYLSKYIIQNKEEYYYSLAAVTQRKAWKPWLIYMLTAIEQTAQHTNRVIDDIISQMTDTYNYTKSKLKWYTLEVNQAIFSQPYIKQKTIGEITGATSRTTLTKYMHQLVSLGVLSVKEDGREVYYVNDDLIRIIQA